MNGLEERIERPRFLIAPEPGTRAQTHAPLNTDTAAGAPRPIEQTEEALRDFDAEADGATILPPTPNDEATLGYLMANADILLAHGEFKSAKELLINILARDSYHLPAIEGLGLCFEKLGQLRQAATCFRSACQMAPTEKRYVKLARLQLRLGEVEAARHAYLEALSSIREESPLLFEIYKELGNIFLKSGDLESAEEYYHKAYVVDSTSDVLFVNMGTLEIQRNQIEVARERFQRAVEINVENDKAWVGLALVHRERKENDLAWGSLLRALDNNPCNETALRLAADWGLRDEKSHIVIPRLQEFLAVHQEHADLSYFLCLHLGNHGQIGEAELEWTRLSALEAGTERVIEFQNWLKGRKDHP